MIKGMTMSKGGSRLPLILGLILGLVAAVLVVVYLTSAKDEGTSTSSSGGDFPVVVARQPIAAGVKITPEMVEIRKVPQADAITGAIGTTEGLVGKVTRVALVANEQISDTKVISSDVVSGFGENPPLSLLIDNGTRGVSAEMSALIGAGGNVRPGDFIDVILIVEVKLTAPDGQTFNDTVAGTVLQNVKVLAIDQERTNPDPAAATSPDKSKQENEAATTVTLSLSTTQAEVIAVADQCGKAHGGRLAMSLRGPGDQNKLSNRSEWPAGGPIPSCIGILGVSTLGD
jgi:pilus assembly protein CpaB